MPPLARLHRTHVLEIEDMPACPSWLRGGVTAIIVTFARSLGVVKVLQHQLARFLSETKQTEIVDLGSGAGGLMPEVVEALRAHPETASTQLTLTDKYPNPETVAHFDALALPHVRYRAESIDATTGAKPVDASTEAEVAGAARGGVPVGLRTMINAFHHLRPEEARQLLAASQAARQPIFIYELTDNRIPFAVWLLTLPLGLAVTFLMGLVFGAMVRPMTPSRLLWTYLLPIYPLVYAWDGQASMPRIYGTKDIEALLAGLKSEDWVWDYGPATNAEGKAVGIYLSGRPS